MIILTFLVSVAFASGSILISSKLRDSYKAGPFSSLLYFQTFYFTFGFYAIWGQLILAVFLSPFLSGDILVKATNLLVLLGSPFVVLTWFMLIKFTRELSGRKTNISAGSFYVTGTILLSAGTGFVFLKLSRFDPFTIIKYGFIILNLGYSLLSAAYLLFSKLKKNMLRRTDIRWIAYGMLIVILLQNILLFLYEGNIYIALAFIAAFFIGGAFMPLYIKYISDLSVLFPEPEGRISVDAFCAKFEISPREKEIIREICKGLSNQQIADKLFISLQTVKDHTSRIYSKINCSSRTQLITLVNENVLYNGPQ
jgi:DNA-binding CsgD family transcriptional regulator